MSHGNRNQVFHGDMSKIINREIAGRTAGDDDNDNDNDIDIDNDNDIENDNVSDEPTENVRNDGASTGKRF